MHLDLSYISTSGRSGGRERVGEVKMKIMISIAKVVKRRFRRV
jgi:hypothetical protein